MTVPKWDDSYFIGLPVFDSEHKLLFAKIGEIHRLIEAGERQEELLRLLDDLLDLFLRHIAWEERWMQKLTTPAGVEHRNRHKEGHRQLAGCAMLLRENIALGNDGRTSLDGVCSLMTLFELIQFDFELVGLLRREGYLSGGNSELLDSVLPDPDQISHVMAKEWHSPKMPSGPRDPENQKPETA